jgi:endo-1,4-beta-xylanase
MKKEFVIRREKRIRRTAGILFSFALPLSFLLVSCAPGSAAAVSATPAPTHTLSVPSVTPTPSSIPSPSSTPYPQLLLIRPAGLYSGPGTARYRVLGRLAAGTTVSALGTFGDFVLASVPSENGGLEGYIWKGAIGDLPASIPELPSDAVPLEPLLYAECLPVTADPAGNSVTFSNPTTDWRSVETNPIPLEAPLVFSIDGVELQVGTYSEIRIIGSAENRTPWWKGNTRIEIMKVWDRYEINVMDGTSENRVKVMEIAGGTDRSLALVFQDIEGKEFDVIYGGNRFGHINVTDFPGLHLPGGIFPKKQVYFGLGIPANESMTIRNLNLGNVPAGKWSEPAAPLVGLAELARARNITIGTELSIRDLPTLGYCRAMQRDFNLAVISEFSWSTTWLGRNKYDFATLDAAVNAARAHGWRIRASHLVWGMREALPGWLLRGNFSREDCIAILKEHVQTLARRYADKVQEWSIANEFFSRSLFLHDDFWYQKIGPDYAEMAFRWAREADPDGILLLNDFNNESPRDGKSRAIIDAMYKKVEEWKAKGVPIDAVGFQMHILLPFSSYPAPKKADVLDTMRKFGGLGVRIFITEMDVDLTRVPGTRDEKLAFQAGFYGEMMDACIESGVCDSFTVWGISDAGSWVSTYFHEANAAPLLFDAFYNPKPAYFAVWESLAGKPPDEWS